MYRFVVQVNSVSQNRPNSRQWVIWGKIFLIATCVSTLNNLHAQGIELQRLQLWYFFLKFYFSVLIIVCWLVMFSIPSWLALSYFTTLCIFNYSFFYFRIVWRLLWWESWSALVLLTLLEILLEFLPVLTYFVTCNILKYLTKQRNAQPEIHRIFRILISINFKTVDVLDRLSST